MLPVVLRASRRPAAWPLWHSPPADWDPMSPSPGTDLKAAQGNGGHMNHSFNGSRLVGFHGNRNNDVGTFRLVS